IVRVFFPFKQLISKVSNRNSLQQIRKLDVLFILFTLIFEAYSGYFSQKFIDFIFIFLSVLQNIL
ncbi:hypothetical protein pb186bvf_000224, partial [Paramecium bursaria]